MQAMLKRTTVAIMTAVTIVVGGLASPAAAHPAQYGWYDNDQLCKYTTGCVRNGDLVRLWQSILWADGRFSSTSNIDGQFGPNTHTWTVQWQTEHMQNDTSGQVGPNTWNTAQSMLPASGPCTDGWAYTEYQGPNRTLFLKMDCLTGLWFFTNPRTSFVTGTDHS